MAVMTAPWKSDDEGFERNLMKQEKSQRLDCLLFICLWPRSKTTPAQKLHATTTRRHPNSSPFDGRLAIGTSTSSGQPLLKRVHIRRKVERHIAALKAAWPGPLPLIRFIGQGKGH
jgi:hypothetical protein